MKRCRCSKVLKASSCFFCCVVLTCVFRDADFAVVFEMGGKCGLEICQVVCAIASCLGDASSPSKNFALGDIGKQFSFRGVLVVVCVRPDDLFVARLEAVCQESSEMACCCLGHVSDGCIVGGAAKSSSGARVLLSVACYQFGLQSASFGWMAEAQQFGWCSFVDGGDGTHYARYAWEKNEEGEWLPKMRFAVNAKNPGRTMHVLFGEKKGRASQFWSQKQEEKHENEEKTP